MSRHSTRLGAGILVGGLLALGASVASREIMRRAGTRLIDWAAVREIAHRRLAEAAAPIPTAQRAEAEAQRAPDSPPVIAATVQRVVPLGFEVRIDLADESVGPFSAQLTRNAAAALKLQPGEQVFALVGQGVSVLEEHPALAI